MDNKQVILIVDDTPENLRSLGDLLEEEYEVRIATNGPDALDIVKLSAPDLILLDIMMPGMGGYEVCRKLKANPDFRMIPVIFMSAFSMSEHTIQAFREGAVDYITKPFQAEEVVARVRAHVQLSKMADLKREIAERKRAEEALRESEARHRRITEGLTDYQYTVRVESGRAVETTRSPLCQVVTGYTVEEFAADPDLRIRIVAPEDVELVKERMQKILAGKEMPPLEHRILRKDGETRWVCDTTILLKDASGHLLSYDGVIKDITERKRAEEALRESEARLTEAQRIAHLGNWELDLVANTLTWSDEVFRLFEVDKERFGASYEAFLAAIHPNDRDAVDAAYTQSRETRKPCLITYRVLMPDGRIKYVQEQCMTYYDPNGKPLRSVGTLQDITERRRLEEQLRQAQKMEAIGQLAGGVAHDFNNILAATFMRLDLMQLNPNLDPETQEAIKELEAGTKRAASLTRQLLMFSRRSVLEIRLLDLNEVVANLLKMLGRLLGEHIALVFERRNTLPLVEADAGMLEQVLMNLAVNARDAMPKGGRITIATEAVEIDPDRAAADPDRRAGRFVCLSVSDTGCGMDAATLNRIFEPFFTTKPAGEGTGLGLATVYGIVAQHRGWVEVQSQVGQGTTFRIHLPASAKAAKHVAESERQVVPRGRETLLVVEDDARVRQILVQNLRVLGYRVFEAANGQEAMTFCRDHGRQIDLLLTDMVMPEGMTGLELAQKVREEKPELKVIISSGYSAEMTEHGEITAAGIVYLPKPYQASLLGKTVRNCLDRK